MSTTTKIQIDTKTFVRFWLVIIGFAVAGFLLFSARVGIAIVLGALFFALAISPLVKKIASIFPSKSRNFSITLSYILVVGFIVSFATIVIPTIVNESIRFFNSLPTLVDSATGDVGLLNKIGLNFGITNLQDQIIQLVQNFSSNMANNLGDIIGTSIATIGTVFAIIILVFVLAFFILTEGPSIMKSFWSSINKKTNTKRAEHVANRLAQTVSTYVSGAVTVALINAASTTIVVFVICLLFGISPGLAFPFGLITGVFCLIPMFGSLIGGLIVSLLLCFNTPWAGAIFLIYSIIYLQIESNVISPKVQGRGMRLPALIILSAVTIGVYTFGLIGAIISIPIAGCVRVLIDEYGADLMDDGKINGSNLVSPKKEVAKKE